MDVDRNVPRHGGHGRSMRADPSGERGERWFRSLFDAHYGELRVFTLRRISNPAAADDVLTEVFAVAWRRRDEVPDPPGPWLAAVCKRVIANNRRSARRWLRLRAKVDSQPPEVGRDPAELVTERSTIAGAFARLDDDQREVLRLVAWDGMSSSEAAAVLDCTPAAFRVRLHRARAALSKQLEQGGHEPQSGRSAAPRTEINPEL